MDRLEQELPRLDATGIKSDIVKALDALKAIRDIAVYFDEYDSNIMAISRLFNDFSITAGNETEQKYKTAVFKLLGIKAEKFEL